MSRPPLEVADIVRQHGDAFLARYGAILSGAQQRALDGAVGEEARQLRVTVGQQAR